MRHAHSRKKVYILQSKQRKRELGQDNHGAYKRTPKLHNAVPTSLLGCKSNDVRYGLPFLIHPQKNSRSPRKWTGSLLILEDPLTPPLLQFFIQTVHARTAHLRSIVKVTRTGVAFAGTDSQRTDIW